MVDEVEEKRLRKEAKRAAKLAAQTELAAAAVVEEEEDDAAEAKRLKKAAKLALKPAAEAETTAAEKTHEKIVTLDPLEENRRAEKLRAKERKAKRAGKAPPQAPKADGESNKRVAEESEEQPRAKKTKEDKVEVDTRGERRARLRAAAKNKEDERRRQLTPSSTGASGTSHGLCATVHPAAARPATVKVDTRKDALKVFVRGLPWSVDEDALRKHFLQCGQIEECLMPKNPAGRSRGVGFLKFLVMDGVTAALKFDNTELGGRQINVAKVEKREGDAKGKGGVKDSKPVDQLTVFIKGLPYKREEADIRKDFEDCGEIESITLGKHEDGRPKGFCFIKFKTLEGVEAALMFDNTDYGGRKINVHKNQPATQRNNEGRGKNVKGNYGKDNDGKGKVGKSKFGKGKGEFKGEDKSTEAVFEGKRKAFADSDDE